jgi:RNA polymerase sigma-70 factor (ECF subfamily)
LTYNKNFGPWRSLASALAWGARGPEFKSRRPDQIPQRHTHTNLHRTNPRKDFPPPRPKRAPWTAPGRSKNVRVRRERGQMQRSSPSQLAAEPGLPPVGPEPQEMLVAERTLIGGNHPRQVYRFQDHLVLETILHFRIILGLENAHGAYSFRRGCHFLVSAVVCTSVDASEEIPLSFEPKARAASGPSLEDVFRLHYPRLVNLLARITGDRGRAEELASEVFCRLSSRPALFRPDGNLDGWLYRTAVNLGLDTLRAESRRRRNEQAAGAEVARHSSAGDPLSEVLRSEQKTRVHAALAALKPVSAKLLLLRHAGLSYSELAGALAVKQVSVGTLLARATAEFEKKYRALHGGE